MSMQTSSLYFGLDIGGTKCAVVAGDENGLILERDCFKSGLDIPPEQILQEYAERIQRLRNKYEQNGQVFRAIGVSCGGPLDSEKGIIMRPPNLPLWDNVPLTDWLTRVTGLPAAVQNDANACALAEWKYGNGRGCRNMIFLTFGTGMGAGLILDGRLYTGACDMAGEVGHIRLSTDGPVGYNKAGSFEGFCSGNGIKRLAQMMVKKAWKENRTVSFCPDESALENITAKLIFEQAACGDPAAVEIVRICAEKLGEGLAILIDILNPERIVIGSIFTRSETQLRDTMIEVIKREALPFSSSVCEICPAGLGEQIGDYASLAVAMQVPCSR